MRRLAKPEVSSVDVFDVCISKVRDGDLKRRLLECRDDIVVSSAEFERGAVNTLLHTIESTDNVSGLVTVAEMKKVYTDRMAKKLAPGRPYYDMLMLLPEHGRCPLCSQRTVSTLDHYLPKAHYPALVVAPINLIPSCQDCNKTKSEVVPASSEEETLHPYYDDVESFVWLHARLTEDNPLRVTFFIEPDPVCTEQLANRISYHFKTFKLDALYSSHAAEELSSIRYIAHKIFSSSGEAGLRSFLTESAVSKEMVNYNSWQSSLYRCLSGSQWFCSGGYLD